MIVDLFHVKKKKKLVKISSADSLSLDLPAVCTVEADLKPPCAQLGVKHGWRGKKRLLLKGPAASSFRKNLFGLSL